MNIEIKIDTIISMFYEHSGKIIEYKVSTINHKNKILFAYEQFNYEYLSFDDENIISYLKLQNVVKINNFDINEISNIKVQSYLNYNKEIQKFQSLINKIQVPSFCRGITQVMELYGHTFSYSKLTPNIIKFNSVNLPLNKNVIKLINQAYNLKNIRIIFDNILQFQQL